MTTETLLARLELTPGLLAPYAANTAGASALAIAPSEASEAPALVAGPRKPRRSARRRPVVAAAARQPSVRPVGGPAGRPGPRPAIKPPATKPAAEPATKPAPIVKWVGGKGRLLAQLTPLLPPGVERMRHVEPFAGGAAMFFARRPERALLCDVNEELVHVYTMVKDRLDDVIGHLYGLAAGHDKEHYYATRSRYNETRAERRGPERAAQFLYLNRTCFNGLHRVNRRGEFNVPAGSYKNPRIVDEGLLYAASAQLQSAEIRHASYEALVESARPGDFVYLDPPYEPVSSTANFTSYAKNGFSQEDQTRLRDVFDVLTRRGVRCMLSNSDVPFIRELYAKHRIDTVAAARAINCDGRGRGLVSEVVVRNY